MRLKNDIFVGRKGALMDIKDLNPDNLEKAAGMLKAIAHPVRISIIGCLEPWKQEKCDRDPQSDRDRAIDGIASSWNTERQGGFRFKEGRQEHLLFSQE